MGRHTDPQTLDLIKKLKEKGEALGYETQQEYPMMAGTYFADLVWQLGKDQSPLVTFEVETEESLRVFKNTTKYFDTLSEDVPKPYRHFIILMKGKLSEGVRKPIQRYINYYNISLFEDVANDQEAVRLLFDELNRLKVNLDDLVTRYLLSGKVNETLSKVIAGIQRGWAPSVLQPKEITLQLSSGVKEDPTRHGFLLSAPGPAFQKMYDAMRTRQTVTLTKEDGVEIEHPQLGTLRPERLEIKTQSIPGILVELETSNYSGSIELVLEKVEEDAEYFILTNAKQNTFYTFNCRVSKSTRQVGIDIKYGPENTDAYQLMKFFDFFDHAKKENVLMFRRADNGQTLMQGPFPPGFVNPPDDSMRFLRALAEIQLKTGVRIPMPKEITPADVTTINRLYQVITTGGIEIELHNLSVSFAKEQAQRIVYRANNPEIIEDFQAITQDESIELFGQRISLGESRVVVPRARINIRKMEEFLNKGIDPIPVEIGLLSEATARIIYPKWSKQSS